MKGIFITFEGPEGSGKSTHSHLLCKYLKRKGFCVVHTREPGGTLLGEKFREILLNPRNKKMSSVAEMLLYMANRSQIVEEIIIPALKKGRVVISDRFLDATISYQGYGSGLDIKMIRHIGRLATRGLRPDLTILLDIPVPEGLRRSKRRDRIERRSLAYHRRVRRGYLKLARLEPKRIIVIPVKRDIGKTQELVREAVCNVLQRGKRSR